MRLVYLLAACAAVAVAQVDTDTITVTSRNSISSRPDSVDVSVSVRAPVGTEIDAVLQVLTGVGVTESDLTDVGESGPFSVCVPVGRGCAPTLAWGFRFSAPIAKLPGTLAALARAESAAPSGFSVWASASSRASAQVPECAYPMLISQARRHAENVGAAAGLRVGRITALSDGTEQSTGIPVSVIRVGDFSQFITATGFVSFLLGPPPYSPPATCAVVVQFQLLR